jgi:hypothetical protein
MAKLHHHVDHTILFETSQNRSCPCSNRSRAGGGRAAAGAGPGIEGARAAGGRGAGPAGAGRYRPGAAADAHGASGAGGEEGRDAGELRDKPFGRAALSPRIHLSVYFELSPSPALPRPLFLRKHYAPAFAGACALPRNCGRA